MMDIEGEIKRLRIVLPSSWRMSWAIEYFEKRMDGKGLPDINILLFNKYVPLAWYQDVVLRNVLSVRRRFVRPVMNDISSEMMEEFTELYGRVEWLVDACETENVEEENGCVV